MAIRSAVHHFLPVKVCCRPHQHVNEERCAGSVAQQGLHFHNKALNHHSFGVHKLANSMEDDGWGSSVGTSGHDVAVRPAGAPAAKSAELSSSGKSAVEPTTDAWSSPRRRPGPPPPPRRSSSPRRANGPRRRRGRVAPPWAAGRRRRRELLAATTYIRGRRRPRRGAPRTTRARRRKSGRVLNDAIRHAPFPPSLRPPLFSAGGLAPRCADHGARTSVSTLIRLKFHHSATQKRSILGGRVVEL